MSPGLTSIGTKRRGIIDFLGLLKRCSIEKLNTLYRLLSWLQNEGDEQYTREDFEKEVELLETGIFERKTAVVCGEVISWRCHGR